MKYALKLILTFTFVWFVQYQMEGLIIQPTPSMTGTFYIKSEEVVLKKNDTVRFVISNPYIFDGKPTSLIKKIKCMPSDVLKIDNEGWVTCNDYFLGMAGDRVNEGTGEVIKMFQYNGVIPEDKAFVMGEHPTSFDSRYYGLVVLSELTKVEKLI
ncbi:S26 family signal peptidase [Vibrio crassostreae]|uniref:S26 family signal peptidase n=1 Tax=Vibrio crassostreae TaxID=246167 RepID=UPI0006369B68|nr:S26 family signal peptidase [Vibrio crassostreae]CDT76347.1 hypothetical protein VCRLGP8_990004 [Vibrio crassostreae]